MNSQLINELKKEINEDYDQCVRVHMLGKQLWKLSNSQTPGAWKLKVCRFVFKHNKHKNEMLLTTARWEQQEGCSCEIFHLCKKYLFLSFQGKAREFNNEKKESCQPKLTVM